MNGTPLIDIDLGYKFYLENDLEQLSRDFRENGVDYDKNFLIEIASGALVVTDLDGIGPLGEKHPKKACDVVIGPSEEATDEKAYFGADAIEYLLTATNTETDVVPISRVRISTDVFTECSCPMWYDISWLATRVSLRATRIDRMISLKAPAIIIVNEYRMGWTALNQLENNGFNNTATLENANGTIIRSLSDVGYSLSKGWSDEMLAHMEESEAKLAMNENDAEE